MPFLFALMVFVAILAAAYPLYARGSARRQRVAAVLAQYGTSAPTTKSTKVQVQPELLDKFGRLIVRGSYRDWLRLMLDRAGVHEANALTLITRKKLMFGAMGLVWGGLLALTGSQFGVLFMIGGAAIGFFLPDLLTYNNAIKRDELVARSLSDALDLLNLCVESGMGLQPALAQVAKSQEGPVAQEFSRVLREMQLGKSRTEAFESLGERTRQPDLKRFVEAVARTESLGIPVASMMKEQATEMRTRRRENAREKAQKVPVKILLPVIACLLPALFIIVMGPAAITMVRAFSQM